MGANMNGLTQFTFNFKDILIEEVSLEGLEGITLELLWKRIETRISRSLTKPIYSRLWSSALQNKEISLFVLQESRQCFELFNRIDVVSDNGMLCDPPDYVDGPYEYCPVTNDRGSCKDYATRQPIAKEELSNSSLDDVIDKYGNRLVLVASLKERIKALVPHLPPKNIEILSPIQYCILELIGKSRENGQASVGKSNLLKVLNNAQLFYTRKLLCKLDFVQQVRIQIKINSTKFMPTYIMKLKRFHVPSLFVLPEKGKFSELSSHLKTMPNFTDSALNIKKLGLPLPNYIKTNKKHAKLFIRKLQGNANDTEPPKKKIKNSIDPDEIVQLNIESDVESDSDTEKEVVTKPCKHMVGINLYRQAYEIILNAGNRGLSAMEFRQALGVGFYTARHILKWFRSKHIVIEYLEEKGRQRIGRYAIQTSTRILDDMMVEKQKLLNYFLETAVKAESGSFEEPSTSATWNNSVDEYSNDSLNQTVEPCNTGLEFNANVSELDINEQGSAYKDLLDSKKVTSMRQIKFANAVLKITREKRVITGFRTLNTLAANEINEVPLDNKNFSSFLYKLAKDSQVKIYSLKWPTSTSKQPKSTLIICAPDVKLDDPVIKAKYNEICFRSKCLDSDSPQLASPVIKKQGKKLGDKSKPIASEKTLDAVQRGHNLRSLALERYKRIQKLHEYLFDLAYNPNLETAYIFGPGYASMSSVLINMPVKLVLGHYSKMSLLKFDNLAITSDMMDTKLKDTPPELHSELSSKLFCSNVFDTVNILATFGLVQLCIPTKITDDHHTGSLKYIFYINRNATILDTRGDWPREDADPETLKRLFYFETLQDVKNYWQTVYDIATNTKVTRHVKRRTLPPVMIRPEKDAPEFDTGQMFGNGAGACGFDSIYYIDQQQQWSKIATAMLSKENVTLLCRPVKKKIVKKKNPTVKKPKRPKPTGLPKKTIRNRIVSSKVPIFKWSNWEDNILTLVKTAVAILSPNVQPGSTAIKNIVAKLLINKRFKTGGICHKRLVSLDNNVALSLKMECLLKEIRRQEDLVVKYDDLFTKLRYKYANSESKYYLEGELATLELIFLLYKISKSENFLASSSTCVASSLKDFYSKFEIKTASDNKLSTMYNMNKVLPPEVQSLKEAVLMAMTSIEESEVPVTTTMKIFNCLSAYSEGYLREVVEQLRTSGVIACKERYLHQQLSNFTLQDLIRVTTSYMKAMSAFRLSAAYRRRQAVMLNLGFGDDLVNTLKYTELSGILRGAPDVNCVSFELQASNAVDIVTVSPPSVVELGRDGSSKDEEPSSEEVTKSIVNAGYVELRKKVPVTSMTELFDPIDFGSLFLTLIQKNIVEQANGAPPRTDKIMNHLRSAGHDGATLRNLQDVWTSDTKSLIRKLERLEKENFITHVGYMDNLVVLSEFAHLWCIKIGEVTLIPCPWVTGDFLLNKPFFMKWCSTIVSKVFEYPGIAISTLVAQHCDVLAARFVQQCCEFLQDLNCVHLNYVNIKSYDLFSDDDLTTELLEYCKYGATDRIVVFPVANMLTTFSYYKSIILENR